MQKSDFKVVLESYDKTESSIIEFIKLIAKKR